MNFSTKGNTRNSVLGGDQCVMRLFHFTAGTSSLICIITFALAGAILCSGCSKAGRPNNGDRLGPIKTALGMFDVDCGRYPTTAEGLEVLFKLPNNTSITNWHGPYIEKVSEPKDPWGHEFVYRCPGIHNIGGYDLYSMGPDGKDGTADDIGNWAVTGQ